MYVFFCFEADQIPGKVIIASCKSQILSDKVWAAHAVEPYHLWILSALFLQRFCIHLK